MKEIVTLQFGEQSNYLGTHFWNTQESYFTYSGEEESPIDHDIHFRPGISPGGSDTFTPRLVLYDLKGAFGSLRKINALYEIEEPSNSTGSLWVGPMAVQKQSPIQPSKYQQHLDEGLSPPPLSTDDVRYWSDYNRVYYHPKSLNHLYEYEFRDRLRPFEKWEVGEDLFSSLDREHDLLDRDLRPFIEECDNMQALQLFSTVNDAWGGFSAKYVEKLRDEFGKTSIWFWALEGTVNDRKTRQSSNYLNSARAVQDISPQVSLYIPISSTETRMPPVLQLDATTPWHTSALQATAIESITLPSRLRSRSAINGKLEDIEAVLTNGGKRTIAKLALNLPSLYPSNVMVEDELRPKQEELIQLGHSPTNMKAAHTYDIDYFTKSYRSGLRRHKRREHVFGEVDVTRGKLPDTQVERPENDPVQKYQKEILGEPRTQRFHATLAFPVLDSFPNIFNNGSTNHSVVTELNVHASLMTTSAVADQVREIKSASVRLFSVGEREAFSNCLESICEEYEDGWNSGTDSGDDE